MPSVPPIEQDYVIDFCAKIANDSSPIQVVCKPRTDCAANECFTIVNEQMLSSGGTMITGWAIWEWPGVFIEAEFHAVWQSPDNELVDLNHRSRAFQSIVFLPDQSRKYEGRQIDNIRRALVQDNDLIRFLYIFRRRFEILNKGSLATQHGEISLPKREEKILLTLMKEGAQLERRLQARYGSSS